MKSYICYTLITLFLLLGCTAAELAAGQLPRSRWLQDVSTQARSQLGQVTVEENANRLAVVVLLTDLSRKGRDRVGLLRLSLQLCAENLFPTTPSSFYVFTNASEVATIRTGLGERLLPNVAVLPVQARSWVAPQQAGEMHTWHSNRGTDYRLMGDWRMSFMPQFARSMGHRYVMQLDDDSFILTPVGENLVSLFDQRRYLLAARNMQRDPPSVTWGLPELARYYLTTRKIVPATLFEFCSPSSLEGLYSRFQRNKLYGELPNDDLDALERLGAPRVGGWNRTILFGNCLMYSLEWWFRPEVNNFVQLCRATGGAFAYRWNEQGVIAMLWQIFVPKEQFYMFQFKYEHRISVEEVLRIRSPKS